MARNNYPRKPQIITDPEKKKRYQNLMDQSRRMTGSEKRNIKRPPKLKRRNTRRKSFRRTWKASWKEEKNHNFLENLEKNIT
jgi:hypothetical protein